MGSSYSHGREFVEQVKPILQTKNTDALIRFLSQSWPNERLRDLLECEHDEAGKVAAFCLMLTGTIEDTPAIAQLLHDDDVFASAFAEQALWSIWFRAGDEDANILLMQAMQAIGENQLEDARDLLTLATAGCPTFAEAYNQRAIVHFLMGDHERATDDCLKTIRLNPYHFGAMAGLGHCYAFRGMLRQSLDAYRCALQLHPRAEGIRQSIQKLRETIELRKAARNRTTPGNVPASPATY